MHTKESTEPISSGTIISAPEEQVRVPVVKERSTSRATIPTIVVPFFLVIASAIGLVFYSHNSRISKQKELYKQYIDGNKAWRDPLVKQYAVLKPYLIEFETINSAKQQDWTKLRSDYDQFVKESAKFDRMRVVASRSSIDVVLLQRQMVDDYEYQFYKASLPNILLHGQASASYRDELENARNELTVDLLHESWTPNSKPQQWQAMRKEFEDQVSKMKPEEVGTRLARFQKGLWQSPISKRAAFESALANEQDIPTDLDLDFAKTLR